MRRAKSTARGNRTGGSKPSSDWRVEALARVRAIIQSADPAIVEAAKWKKPSNPAGVPTWSRDGVICTGETYTDKLKLTFAKGAALRDPARLFNASLDGNVRRAIDIGRDDEINARALKALVRAAVALNAATAAKKPRPAARKTKRP